MNTLPTPTQFDAATALAGHEPRFKAYMTFEQWKKLATASSAHLRPDRRGSMAELVVGFFKDYERAGGKPEPEMTRILSAANRRLYRGLPDIKITTPRDAMAALSLLGDAAEIPAEESPHLDHNENLQVELMWKLLAYLMGLLMGEAA